MKRSRAQAIRDAYEAELPNREPEIVRRWKSLRFRFKMAWLALAEDGQGIVGAIQTFFTSRLYSDIW